MKTFRNRSNFRFLAAKCFFKVKLHTEVFFTQGYFYRTYLGLVWSLSKKITGKTNILEQIYRLDEKQGLIIVRYLNSDATFVMENSTLTL